MIAVFNSTRTMAHVQVAFKRAGFYTRDCIVYRRHSGIPRRT
jgi:site-specific DNA-methyltransferase (adenine-specific)